MKKIILTFGDSWPQGAELNCSNGKPYGKILQELLDFDVFLNYGVSGSSNEDMIIQLRQYLDHKHVPGNIVVAVFHLTNPSRTAYFPHGFNWNVSCSEIENHVLFKELFCHFYNDKLESIRTNVAVTTLQSWCRCHNIEDYYFSGWIKYPKWMPEVNVDKIWAQAQETAGDWFGATEFNREHLENVQNNVYIKPNLNHPNQLGHELIAQKLASWIAK